jgi:hypothetical protein
MPYRKVQAKKVSIINRCRIANRSYYNTFKVLVLAADATSLHNGYFIAMSNILSYDIGFEGEDRSMPTDALAKEIVATTAEQEFQLLDQQILNLMRRLEVKTLPDWKNLIACTQRAGLTLRDIAVFLPCSVSTVSRWQSGKAAPPAFMREPLKTTLIKLVESRLTANAQR